MKIQTPIVMLVACLSVVLCAVNAQSTPGLRPTSSETSEHKPVIVTNQMVSSGKKMGQVRKLQDSVSYDAIVRLVYVFFEGYIPNDRNVDDLVQSTQVFYRRVFAQQYPISYLDSATNVIDGTANLDQTADHFVLSFNVTVTSAFRLVGDVPTGDEALVAVQNFDRQVYLRDFVRTANDVFQNVETVVADHFTPAPTQAPTQAPTTPAPSPATPAPSTPGPTTGAPVTPGPTGNLATNDMLEFKCPDFLGAANLSGIGQGELYSCPDLCGVMHPATIFKSLQEDDSPIYPKSFWQYNAFASYPYRGDTRSCSSGAPLIKTDAGGAIDDLCEDIVGNCDPWCDFEADIENDVLGADGSDLECYCNVLKVRTPPSSGITFGACEGSISGEYSIAIAGECETCSPGVTLRAETRVNYDVYEILSREMNITYMRDTSDSVLFTVRYNSVIAEGTKVMASLSELFNGALLAESCTYSVNDEFECACVPDTAPACISQPLLICPINGEVVTFNCAANTDLDFAESIVNALAATPSPEPVPSTPPTAANTASKFPTSPSPEPVPSTPPTAANTALEEDKGLGGKHDVVNRPWASSTSFSINLNDSKKGGN